MKDHEQSCGQTPVVYAVGDKGLMELLDCFLGEKGQSCRTFTDAHALYEAFASVRPRPVVLITGCLDHEGTGLRLIQKCTEIEPGLKVILWSGHLEATLASLLAKVPVIPDARLSKGKEIDLEMERLVETIEGLVTVTLQARPAAS